MYDSLLRSTKIFDALAHRCTIISEGDSDRSFYSEINRRLIHENRGIRDALFINAQNKQTICRLKKPLKELGLPSVGIFDFDFLKPGENNFDKTLRTFGVNETELNKIKQQLNEIWSIYQDLFSENSKEKMKNEGIRAINDESNKQIISSFLDHLKKYGIFIVSNGELETWLRELEIPTNKKNWLENMFDRLGSDPQHENYVRSGMEDVWLFLDEIEQYIQRILSIDQSII